MSRIALDALNFESAAAAESKTWRNLLPPEPWLNIVERQPKAFGNFARHCLSAGVSNAPSVVTRVRKPHQQTRPVPVVGIAERIAYRAMCDAVLAGRPPADRSSNAYETFIAGPITTAFGRRRRLRVADARVQYVIESDIAAFYEYVDHSRLLDELQLRTSTVELPRYLVQLLTEVQGRPFGLPQLLDSSDELSELYIRIVERELRRRGILVWRYNDDFRLTATTYDEAQSHVESLAHEASKVGLVLNERKTRLIKFQTYFWNNWADPPQEGDIEFKPELIRIHSEYGELEDDAMTNIAHATIDLLTASSKDNSQAIDPKKLTAQQTHDLNRAIGILTRQSDIYALSHIPRLFEFAPHLSHRLGAYLVALAKANVDISQTWDHLSGRGKFFNAWQRLWLVYIARVAGLLEHAPRRDWVNAQSREIDPLLRAESTLALAPHKMASFDEIDRAIRREPEALLPWYALAAKAIPNTSATRLQALKDSHGLIDLLIRKPSKNSGP